MAHLEIQHVDKVFAGVHALNDVSFSIERGVIHGLVGKNGAGKTTLVKIISGLYTATTGNIILDGKTITNLGIREVEKAGIRICTQHVNIIPQLTVKENLALGDWPKNKFGFINWNKLTREVREKAERFGLDVDIEKNAGELSLTEKRQVNIIHSLLAGAEIIILDEPTTSLSPKERKKLFDFMVELREKQNITFIFISHYSEEILEYCDTFTVLRNGSHIMTDTVDVLDEEKLSSLIIGKKVRVFTRDEKPDYGKLLEVHGLSGKNFDSIDLTLYKGEILGLAGLPGSGAREFIRALYGLGKIDTGEIILDGEPVTVKNPWEARHHGISYLSNDRLGEGIVGILSIKDNIAMSNFDKVKNSLKLLDETKITAQSKKVIEDFNVVTPGIHELTANLSGGNQQKVCLGMAFNTDPRLVMLDEPARGIDVEVKEDVHRIIDLLSREEQIAFIYFSTDFEEMCRVVDRAIVFAHHVIASELSKEELTIGNIVNAFSANVRTLKI